MSHQQYTHLFNEERKKKGVYNTTLTYYFYITTYTYIIHYLNTLNT